MLGTGFLRIRLNGRSTNNKYENWLASIEGDASRVVPLPTSRQQLCQADATVWSAFVALSLPERGRSASRFLTQWSARFEQQTDDPDFILDMQYELLRQGELCYADGLREDTEKLRAAMDASPSFPVPQCS